MLYKQQTLAINIKVVQKKLYDGVFFPEKSSMKKFDRVLKA